MDVDALVLNPSARVLWRGEDTVQLELGRHAVVVEGVEPDVIRALTARARPTDLARAKPVAAQPARTPNRQTGLAGVLNVLAANGYVWPRPSTVEYAAHPALAGELATLRVRHGTRAEHILAQRAQACVVIHGTGRLAVAIATGLAGSNVGRITLHDTGAVRIFDTAPGGLTSDDEGHRFREAAHDAVRRSAPGVDTRTIGPDERPNVAVLTGDSGLDVQVIQGLHDRGVAHLAVRTGPDDAAIGPLVLPGLTSCLGCADLTRLDRDPAWSLLAVQLSTPPRPAPASGLTVMTLAAGLATSEILSYLDGDEPNTLAGSLELQLPDWRIRRRSWPVHPSCGCGADQASAGYEAGTGTMTV